MAHPWLKFLSYSGKLLNGFPRWLSGKESTCNAEDVGSVPALGRSPGKGNGNPFQWGIPWTEESREAPEQFAWGLAFPEATRAVPEVPVLSPEHLPQLEKIQEVPQKSPPREVAT